MAYAIVAYRTAYMKCHYPREYMAALLTSVLDSSTKVAEYIAECKELGIKLLPPDVNESDADFTVSGENIRFGLVAIKGIGRGFIQELMRDRELNGPFTAFDEFCRRMYGKDLNRRAAESLIRSGAFDSMGYKRKALLQVVNTVIEGVAMEGRANIEGQMDLFGFDAVEEDKPEVQTLVLPNVEEFTPQELMAMEKETTGLFLSGHPMDEYRSQAKRVGAVPIGAIIGDFASENGPKTYADDQIVTIAGVVSTTRTRTTRNNSLMAYITLEDDTGSMELIAFQRALDTGGGYIRENAALLVRGRISVRDEKEPQLVVDSVRPLSDLSALPEEPAQRKSGARTLYVRLKGRNSKEFKRIELILKMFPGREKLILYFEDTKKRVGAQCVVHEALVAELEEMLGKENVVVK